MNGRSRSLHAALAVLVAVLGAARSAGANTIGLEWELATKDLDVIGSPPSARTTGGVDADMIVNRGGNDKPNKALLCTTATVTADGKTFPRVAVTYDLGDAGGRALEIVTGPIDHKDAHTLDDARRDVGTFLDAVISRCQTTPCVVDGQVVQSALPGWAICQGNRLSGPSGVIEFRVKRPYGQWSAPSINTQVNVAVALARVANPKPWLYTVERSRHSLIPDVDAIRGSMLLHLDAMKLGSGRASLIAGLQAHKRLLLAQAMTEQVYALVAQAQIDRLQRANATNQTSTDEGEDDQSSWNIYAEDFSSLELTRERIKHEAAYAQLMAQVRDVDAAILEAQAVPEQAAPYAFADLAPDVRAFVVWYYLSLNVWNIAEHTGRKRATWREWELKNYYDVLPKASLTDMLGKIDRSVALRVVRDVALADSDLNMCASLGTCEGFRGLDRAWRAQLAQGTDPVGIATLTNLIELVAAKTLRVVVEIRLPNHPLNKKLALKYLSGSPARVDFVDLPGAQTLLDGYLADD